MHDYRTGLLVIRVWIEDGSDEPLRAQIRHTGDVNDGFTQEISLTHADGVLEAVAAFLKSVAELPAPP